MKARLKKKSEGWKSTQQKHFVLSACSMHMCSFSEKLKNNNNKSSILVSDDAIVNRK